MSRFLVTIQQTILTKVEVDAETAADARRAIEEYDPLAAAKDMATQDNVTVKIKSVKRA